MNNESKNERDERDEDREMRISPEEAHGIAVSDLVLITSSLDEILDDLKSIAKDATPGSPRMRLPLILNFKRIQKARDVLNEIVVNAQGGGR